MVPGRNVVHLPVFRLGAGLIGASLLCFITSINYMSIHTFACIILHNLHL